MPTGHIPILQIKTKDGKWLPVNAIGGQVASKVLYNNAYPTVEQALDYLFENGTGGGGGGTGGASTAANVSYTNTQLPNVKNVKTALDELVPDSHNHNNKNILDKLSDSNGKLQYNGETLGGGGGTSDFIIKMTVESDDNGNYTVTSCDATVEQIDEAVAAEKKVVLNASVDGLIIELQMVQYVQGDASIFSAFLSGMVIYSSVYKVGNESEWNFEIGLIPANSVDYSNAALPSISTVGDALDKLVTKSHTHSNKDTLDNLSVSNGKLQYNGSDVGLKPSQVTTGTNITLADNTEYRLTDVTTLTLTYPTGDFECWMRLSCAASDKVTVTLPAGTKYIGAAPDFKNGETWELSFKDKVLVAQKVGDGSMTPIETVEDGTEVSY